MDIFIGTIQIVCAVRREARRGVQDVASVCVTITRLFCDMKKVSKNFAITDGVGLRETADKSGSQCTGRLNDVLPIYVMR